MRQKRLRHQSEYWFALFRHTLLTLDSRNPEDCLPLAGTAHARQLSQPDSSGGSPPSRNDGSSSRLTQPEAITTVGETLEEPPEAPTRRPPSPSPHAAPSFHRPFPAQQQQQQQQQQRPRGATRKMSKGGGVQMVLEEAGSWSELADQRSTLPAEGVDNPDAKGKGNSGMLSFFSRKKGRDRSPKPQEPGVLGKEGARQIIT